MTIKYRIYWKDRLRMKNPKKGGLFSEEDAKEIVERLNNVNEFSIYWYEPEEDEDDNKNDKCRQ